jgi:hypothetical protein
VAAKAKPIMLTDHVALRQHSQALKASLRYISVYNLHIFRAGSNSADGGSLFRTDWLKTPHMRLNSYAIITSHFRTRFFISATIYDIFLK